MAKATRSRKQSSSRRKSPTRKRTDALDPVFKALANADRRAILDLIREAPLTTGGICEQLDWLDRCTVMLHLRTLEQADLVIAKREGRCRWNYLNCEPIQRAYRRWIRDYAEPAAGLLSDLKQQLESS
ncbi:MAG: ArsR/SmtB family transcription factor [Pirellulaceae bacterium]